MLRRKMDGASAVRACGRYPLWADVGFNRHIQPSSRAGFTALTRSFESFVPQLVAASSIFCTDIQRIRQDEPGRLLSMLSEWTP